MCMCMHCVFVHMECGYRCPPMPEDGVGSPRAGEIGSCELSIVGAGMELGSSGRAGSTSNY